MTDLKTFVQSQLEHKNVSEGLDWTRRREKWLQSLDQLFEFIRKSLIEAGLPPDHVTSSTHTLREESLGQYEAPGLIVMLPAGGNATFTPVGSVIIGGFGRVDVTGPARERVKLIVEDASEDRPADDKTASYDRLWSWRVYPALGRKGSFPLDEQGLARLMEIVAELK
jgi:hypothetical protein